MITDKLATFADNTLLNTGAAGDYVIGDVVDLGANFQLWDVADLYFVVTVDPAATSGGSATLQVSLTTADNAALTTNAQKVISTPVVPVAQLTQGKVVGIIGIPKGYAWKRYLGITQTTGTAAFTAGGINAFMTKDPTNWRAFADALTAGQ